MAMEMVQPYVKKWNQLSEQHKAKDILIRIIPSIDVHLTEHVLPLLSPIGFDINGICLLSVAVFLGIGAIFAVILGLLQFLIQILSITLVSRRTIIALSTNAKETKVYLIYFLFFGLLNVLETSVFSVFLSAIPFYSLAKTAFLFFCSTPESGFSLYLYTSFIQPYLGNPKNEAKEQEPEKPKLCCNVQGYESNVQDDGELHVIVQFAGDTVQYLTSVKKSDVLKLPLPDSYPTKSESLIFTLISKHALGSDVTLGISNYELDSSYESSKCFDLNLLKSTEDTTPTGKLTIELEIN
jgi:hypothetical protein